ncbi:PREDICTED: nascent polypeptide-associated complex subunit alpha, muscle-specific form-like [Cercocebus atys]|uniref:nascent polypeptide-associated complex subunit alpha, muscle-specific form-like n=1 Tax=Cercocebus atys TaxID=9531 RepID=UPI0005F4B0F9|nr:PREDICTED: nascent polypeptide-associated complex subunit alpha, muscle-specific form-like [Cercocebus atys]
MFGKRPRPRPPGPGEGAPRGAPATTLRGVGPVPASARLPLPVGRTGAAQGDCSAPRLGDPTRCARRPVATESGHRVPPRRGAPVSRPARSPCGGSQRGRHPGVAVSTSPQSGQQLAPLSHISVQRSFPLSVRVAHPRPLRECWRARAGVSRERRDPKGVLRFKERPGRRQVNPPPRDARASGRPTLSPWGARGFGFGSGSPGELSAERLWVLQSPGGWRSAFQAAPYLAGGCSRARRGAESKALGRLRLPGPRVQGFLEDSAAERARPRPDRACARRRVPSRRIPRHSLLSPLLTESERCRTVSTICPVPACLLRPPRQKWGPQAAPTSQGHIRHRGAWRRGSQGIRKPRSPCGSGPMPRAGAPGSWADLPLSPRITTLSRKSCF